MSTEPGSPRRLDTKTGAAAVSIASNSLLILLKVGAAALTGSVAILSEAIHSSIDLMASVIAFVSVRMSDEPADSRHHYGHQKAESLAAAVEGLLILLGAGVIVFEAARRIADGAEVTQLGVGIAIIAFSICVNAVVSTYLRRAAKRHESPALAGDAAHLSADTLTSLGVLAGLIAVKFTGIEVLDSIVAIVVAIAIVAAGVRILVRSAQVLMDSSPPDAELDRIEAAIAGARPLEMVGYHQLRARYAGRRRHVDMHVQFREGTTLERAHELTHELRNAIEAELPEVDVMIHAEPEASRRTEAQPGDPFRSG